MQSFVNYSSDLVVFQISNANADACLLLMNDISLLGGVFQSQSISNLPMLLLHVVRTYLILLPGATNHNILATKDQGNKRWIINGSALKCL